MSKYEFRGTPGPWMVSEAYDEVSVVMGTAIDSPHEYTCSHVWQCPGVYWGETDDEDLANAQAISMIPQLIETLQRVLQDIPDVIQAEALDYIEEALTEATTPPT